MTAPSIEIAARGSMLATAARIAGCVAELAVGVIIAAARAVPAADRSMRAGQPDFRQSARFSESSGKTALIGGRGPIGRDAGRMPDQAFGMNIPVYSPRAPGGAGGGAS